MRQPTLHKNCISKTIWFINKEAAPSKEYATHIRTIRQAQFFQSHGHNVKVFCSSVVHNSAIVHRFAGLYKEEMHDGVPIVFVKCPEYGESFVKRVLAFVVFSVNMLRIKGLKEPDIIVHESKTPFDILIMRLRKKYKARYIVDIEDLWPYEFEQIGIVKPSNPVLKLFYKLQKYIYAKGEHTVISVEGGKDYVLERKWDKEHGGPIDINRIHYVNNGISIQEFADNVRTWRIEDEDLTDKSVFKVIYLGSIRLANNLDKLLDAAKYITDKRVKILIFGNGDERERLEKRVADEHITNIIFKNKWIELKYVPYVLSCADLNLLNYGSNWAPYGGSMNKMIMAFASGKPLLCNADMPYSEITRHNLGIDQKFDSAEAYAAAIESFVNLSQAEYTNMCKRVREVSKRYDSEYLNNNFAKYCEIEV